MGYGQAIPCTKCIDPSAGGQTVASGGDKSKQPPTSPKRPQDDGSCREHVAARDAGCLLPGEAASYTGLRAEEAGAACADERGRKVSG